MNTKLIVILCLITSNCCSDVPILSGILGEVIKSGGGLIQGGHPDGHRNPCQLIESRNFICDEHFVITNDSYILSIQHVINPVLIAKNKKTIGPVILQHGLLGSGTSWLINSEGGFADDWTGQVINVDLNIAGRNAAYLLANLGYDVWVTNLRGCRYSRNHTHLNPDKDPSFWKFSYEQMITYDAPTFIDYVLKQTGHSKLAWIGHSLGTAVIFGLLSERPEYSAKLKPFIALAPVAHVGHITAPIRIFAEIPTLKQLLAIESGEFDLPKPIIDLLADKVCVISAVNQVCESLLYIFGGNDFEQMDMSRLSVYIEGGFCGTSTWTLAHFAYNVIKNQFAKFDYGLLGNIDEYATSNPPQYNLSAINLENIVLIDANNDQLADPIDVKTLKNSLTVPYIEYTVPYPKFSHLDFVFAKNVYSQVYEPMVRFLKKLS